MRLSLPLALLIALPATACLSQGGSGDNTETEDIATSLEQTNGGYDTEDEAPLFGAEAEAVFAAGAIEAETAVADPFAVDPSVVSLDSARAGFQVVVLWGKLPADRNAEEIRDWSGSLQISRGALVVRHTIGFEDRTDHLLPRTVRDTVAFESVTKPYVDGLALTVVDPTVSPNPTDRALALTYTSKDGTTSLRLELAQLANGPVVVDAGGGFKMIAIAHRRLADPCDRGFMRGRWHAVSPTMGRFFGIVANEEGERVGHVRGIYGQRRDGEPVLFGKFINREGHFRGILTGTFGDGTYRARWVTRAGDHGTAHGVYFAGPNERAGGFLGRWAETSCTDDAPPAEPTRPGTGG
jgi:hypothetical protein